MTVEEIKDKRNQLAYELQKIEVEYARLRKEIATAESVDDLREGKVKRDIIDLKVEVIDKEINCLDKIEKIQSAETEVTAE